MNSYEQRAVLVRLLRDGEQVVGPETAVRRFVFYAAVYCDEQPTIDDEIARTAPYLDKPELAHDRARLVEQCEWLRSIAPPYRRAVESWREAVNQLPPFNPESWSGSAPSSIPVENQFPWHIGFC